MRIRNLKGKWVSRRDARHIAAQVTSLPVEEPHLPEFAARGEHPHANCRCWDEMERQDQRWRR